MNKKGKTNTARLVLTFLGFILIAGGSYLARFNAEERIGILGGIIVAIGVGLLSFARTI